MKRIEQIMAAAQESGCTTEVEMDAWLTAQGIEDPTQRIAAKHALQAAGDQASSDFRLATDVPSGAGKPPISREMATLLRKTGLTVDRRYTDADITEALSRSGLDVVEKVAIRAELGDRGLILAGTPRPRQGQRAMEAGADRPKGHILRNADGRPITLRFGPI